MITETKLDDFFTVSQFEIEAFSTVLFEATLQLQNQISLPSYMMQKCALLK